MTDETLIIFLLFFVSLAHYYAPALWLVPLNGFSTMIGPRDDLKQSDDLAAQRTTRAQHNFKETLPWGLGLLILVQVTGDTNGMTALGGWMYLLGRIAYLPLYISGVVWWRSIAWLVAMMGLLLIVLQLL